MNIIYKLLNIKEFSAALDQAEREIYIAAFNHTNGNQVQTAKLLEISRGTLRNRLKKWGVK